MQSCGECVYVYACVRGWVQFTALLPPAAGLTSCLCGGPIAQWSARLSRVELFASEQFIGWDGEKCWVRRSLKLGLDVRGEEIGFVGWRRFCWQSIFWHFGVTIRLARLKSWIGKSLLLTNYYWGNIFTQLLETVRSNPQVKFKKMRVIAWVIGSLRKGRSGIFSSLLTCHLSRSYFYNKNNNDCHDKHAQICSTKKIAM